MGHSVLLPLAAALPLTLAAACGGNVVVDQPAPDECAAGLAPCGGECVDLNKDVFHCGECGFVCPEGYCGGGQCVNEPPCDEGYEPCDGGCVDVKNNPQSCGHCGNACPEGWYCSEGGCALDECSCVSFCEYTEIGSGVPQTVFKTVTGADQTSLTCGGPGGPDVIFAFSAPYASTFFFDTFGTDGPTVLQAVSQSCDPVGCNDSYTFDGTSALKLGLTSGAFVFLVVEAKVGVTVQLNVTDVGDDCWACSEAFLDEEPPGPICADGLDLYLDVVSCVCETCGGPCDELCAGGPIGAECESCVSMACIEAIQKCANDL